MGGNGPHSGARNSSFGLATLRRDGYAAVRASATTSDPSPPSTLWLNMPESLASPRLVGRNLDRGPRPTQPLTPSRFTAQAHSSLPSSKSPRRGSPSPPTYSPVARRLDPSPPARPAPCADPRPIVLQPSSNTLHRRQPADWSRSLVAAHGGGLARQPVGTARRECDRRTHRLRGRRHLRAPRGRGGGPRGARHARLNTHPSHIHAHAHAL